MISISNNSMKPNLQQYLMQYHSIFFKRSFDTFTDWLWASMYGRSTIYTISLWLRYQKYTDKVLNSIYYFLSYLKSTIESLTVIQVKYGDNFACYSKLFDYAKKTGNKYLNSHCFVSLVLNIPLKYTDNVRYLSLLVHYHMYSTEQKVLINLFEKSIYVTVTTTYIETFSSLRVYISSVDPDEIDVFRTPEVLNMAHDELQSKILFIYRMRWNVEVIFYQYKFF